MQDCICGKVCQIGIQEAVGAIFEQWQLLTFKKIQDE